MRSIKLLIIILLIPLLFVGLILAKTFTNPLTDVTFYIYLSAFLAFELGMLYLGYTAIRDSGSKQ